jgi:hypothetical protein
MKITTYVELSYVWYSTFPHSRDPLYFFRIRISDPWTRKSGSESRSSTDIFFEALKKYFHRIGPTLNTLIF